MYPIKPNNNNMKAEVRRCKRQTGTASDIFPTPITTKKEHPKISINKPQPESYHQYHEYYDQQRLMKPNIVRVGTHPIKSVYSRLMDMMSDTRKKRLNEDIIKINRDLQMDLLGLYEEKSLYTPDSPISTASTTITTVESESKGSSVEQEAEDEEETKNENHIEEEDEDDDTTRKREWYIDQFCKQECFIIPTLKHQICNLYLCQERPGNYHWSNSRYLRKVMNHFTLRHSSVVFSDITNNPHYAGGVLSSRSSSKHRYYSSSSNSNSIGGKFNKDSYFDKVNSERVNIEVSADKRSRYTRFSEANKRIREFRSLLALESFVNVERYYVKSSHSTVKLFKFRNQLFFDVYFGALLQRCLDHELLASPQLVCATPSPEDASFEADKEKYNMNSMFAIPLGSPPMPTPSPTPSDLFHCSSSSPSSKSCSPSPLFTPPPPSASSASHSHQIVDDFTVYGGVGNGGFDPFGQSV